jgi:hypothetical protein
MKLGKSEENQKGLEVNETHQFIVNAQGINSLCKYLQRKI